MAKRRLIIHIGTHKTGTTSIQRTLARNRRRLSLQSIWYPDQEIIGKRTRPAHVGMANALAGDHPKYTEDDAREFFKLVVAGSKKFNSTIVSAESMYRQMLPSPGSSKLTSSADYWQRRRSYISRIKECIPDAEIAIVIRRQADFAESMYQENVKVTKYKGTFQDFLSEYWYHFDYLGQIEAWMEYFPKCQIIPFESIKGPKIASNFLSLLRLRPFWLVHADRHNIGLPHDLVILKRELNREVCEKFRLVNGLKIMRSSSSIAPDIRKRRSFFDSFDAKLTFQEGFEIDNKKLARLISRDHSPLFDPLKPNSDVAYGDCIEESVLEAWKSEILKAI